MLNKASSCALVAPVVFPAKQQGTLHHAALSLHSHIVHHLFVLRSVTQPASNLNAKLLYLTQYKQTVYMYTYLCQGTECSGPD